MPPAPALPVSGASFLSSGTNVGKGGIMWLLEYKFVKSGIFIVDYYTYNTAKYVRNYLKTIPGLEYVKITKISLKGV
jgi:hypothetical protein